MSNTLILIIAALLVTACTATTSDKIERQGSYFTAARS